MRGRFPVGALLAVVASLALATAAAGLTTGQLPGGTSISVDNTSPVDGDEFLIPLGQSTLDIPDAGTAQVGGGAVVKDTTIVYVIDVSGSTSLPSGVDCNGDASGDTILVCEQVGAVAANTAAADPLSVVANSGVVSFSDPATIELGLTADFSAVTSTINGLTAAGFTNYEAGVRDAQTVLSSPAAQTNRIVVFLSDGFANRGTLVGVPSFGPDTVVKAFAIGSPAAVTCGGGSASGTLDQVADLGAANSNCQQVTDPSLLDDLITQAVGSTLASVELSIDGGGFGAIPAGDLDTTLPLGPDFNVKTANWSTPVVDLGPGLHEICARANGQDAGGSGSVTDCKTIRLLQLQNDGTEVEATNELGVDDTHTISVRVAGDAGGTDVTFDVAGVNGQVQVVQTDADGRASFTFNSPQDPTGLGDDSITVSIEVDGESQELTFTKSWLDTTPPAAYCTGSVNPDGRNEPGAPGNGGQGQNQDGFYEIGGEDDIWPASDLQVFVTDSGSGTVFGPYSVSDVIKYTEANGTRPREQNIGGPNSAVVTHILGNGDGVVTVVDGSGNVSDGADCLVPDPPK